MARKVLISFVGTGALKEDKKDSNKSNISHNERDYRTATYKIDEKEYTTSFVADALVSHYQVNDIILIGTVKSMWEAVYQAFCKKHGVEKNDDYYLELGVYCEQANHTSPLELPNIEKLEKALGGNSHVVLINYGLTEGELENNMSTILGLEKYLNTGDELYVDITHAFRSLPMFLMNTLIYLQNVSRKQIKICHILYGMLDVSKELGYAQVVDLKKIIDVNDWISGAYSFMEFGNAYKISKLLEPGNSTSQVLRDFSDSKNINNIYALQKQVQRLRSIGTLPPIAQMTISPVVKDFISRLGRFNCNSEFQYKLAVWHKDKHNYSAAYLTLVEAIITYVCEQCKYNDSDKNERELAKNKLMNEKKYEDLKSIYNEANEIRKTIAHAVTNMKSNSDIIRILNDSINQLKETLLC